MSSVIESKNIHELNIAILSNNLRYLMNKVGIDAVRLYEMTGIAATTINNLRRGMGNPTLSTLQSLSDFFNVSIGELTEKNLANLIMPQISSGDIPLIDINEIDNFFSATYKQKKSIHIELTDTLKEKSFAIKLSNGSMAPFFEKGTVFIICKDIIAQDGDIVLVRFGKNPACFRRVFIEEKAHFFGHISEILGKDLVKSKNFVIYGVVIKAIQYFHE